MKLFNKKNKETRSLPMDRKGKSAFAVYTALVLMLCCCTTTAFAASDPLTVINNLSDYVCQGNPHAHYGLIFQRKGVSL